MGNIINRIWKARSASSFDQAVQEYLKGGDAAKVFQKDIDVSGSNALQFSGAFACCRVLAETFASIPLMEYKRLDSGDRERTDETGLYDVLHFAFNDQMTAYNGKEVGMYQINLGGNAIYEKVSTRGGGLAGLYPIEWSRVNIEMNDDGRLIYIIDGKKDEAKTRNNIFHVAGPSLNGYTGLSPIEYAAQAIRLGLQYEKFGVNFYKNGAMPSGMFTHPGVLKDDAYKRLNDTLKSEWTGLTNSGKPLLLEDGLSYAQLTMKLADAELLGSKKFQIEDVCRIYRVPLHLVQNLDRATNNNIEHQSLEFVMYTMLPHVKRWEENINMQLLTRNQRKNGYYYEFNISTLLRGDQKSMAESFAAGRQWGWLSVNDVRRLLNLNSIGEQGDIYLQPSNMVDASNPQALDANIVNEMKTLIESKK